MIRPSRDERTACHAEASNDWRTARRFLHGLSRPAERLVMARGPKSSVPGIGCDHFGLPAAGGRAAPNESARR